MSYGQEWLLTEWECPMTDDDDVETMERCTIYDLLEKVKTGDWVMNYIDDCWVLTYCPDQILRNGYARHYSKVGRY